MFSARSICHLVLAIGLGTTLCAAQGQDRDENKPEDQVKRVERDWLTADGKGDTASLQRIISDDFIGSGFGGGLLNKRDIIPEGTGPGGFAGATPGETNVRIFGNTGVLMGVINTAAGPQAQRIRVTLVCQKRGEDWQIIAAQLTH